MTATSDRDQLATWEAELAAQAERLEQMSQERARQAADVEHRIEHAEAMRAKAASDSVLHASLGEQIEALHGLRRMMQSELGEIPADRRLAQRYLADLDDRLGRPHAVLANVIERLVHDEDRIVHNRTDQDHEAEHREHVQWLQHEQIEQPQTENAAHRTQRHREDDHDGVEP